MSSTRLLPAAKSRVGGHGVGVVLLEETDYDHRNGAPMSASMADYLVSTHADLNGLAPVQGALS
jgi:hypothetical protein